MQSSTLHEGTAPLGAPGVAVHESSALRTSRAVDVGCRALDLLVSSVLVVLLAPLLIGLVIAVRLDSPGPAIFRQRRIGRDRRPFTVHKFRTMYDGSAHDAHREFVVGLINGEEPRQREAEAAGDAPVDGETALYYKMIEDTRVTRLGRLLRRSSLDELPQLWNVLRGDMSLVGPRPPIPYEVEHYPAHWFARFAVKPGITGLWQVNGRSKVTLEQMVQFDIEYARNRSLWLNITILARTIPAVLGARGAW